MIRLTKSEERRLRLEWGLTPREVAAVSLFMRDMRADEAARVMGIVRATVATLLSRARRRLGGRNAQGFAVAVLTAIGRIRTTKARPRSQR